MEYLGHLVSEQGVAVDHLKVKAVLDWPAPTSIKGLRGFLGLTGYYRKFIKNYGKIAKPLTDLLKKGAFGWNEEAQCAFEQLRSLTTEAPVLALPDFNKSFAIECDASGKGIGAVLLQESRPVAYFSKVLADRTATKSTYEKELMALVLSIQHWRPYLLGRKFTVYTDQRSLKYLLEQRVTTQDQQVWLSKLLGYDFEIIYKQGINNRVADALSRREVEGELNGMTRPFWLDVDKIDEEVRKDPYLSSVIAELEKNSSSHRHYTLQHGKLLYKGRLVLSSHSA